MRRCDALETVWAAACSFLGKARVYDGIADRAKYRDHQGCVNGTVVFGFQVSREIVGNVGGGVVVVNRICARQIIAAVNFVGFKVYRGVSELPGLRRSLFDVCHAPAVTQEGNAPRRVPAQCPICPLEPVPLPPPLPICVPYVSPNFSSHAA